MDRKWLGETTHTQTHSDLRVATIKKSTYGDRSEVSLQLGLVILDVLSEREGELGGHDGERGARRGREGEKGKRFEVRGSFVKGDTPNSHTASTGLPLLLDPILFASNLQQEKD